MQVLNTNSVSNIERVRLGSLGGTSGRLRDDAIGVSGLVDSAAFLGQVVLPVASKSLLLRSALSLRIASAPSSPQRAPVMSSRSATMWRQAPSITPVAIGQPLLRAVG